VTSPLVNLRVLDASGTYVLQGFYAGGVLPEDVHEDDLQRHVRKGMVAEQGTKEADAATPYGKPVVFDDAGMPMSDAAVAEAEEKRQARVSRTTAAKPEQKADQKAGRPAARPES
jgi:hypothetical protein